MENWIWLKLELISKVIIISSMRHPSVKLLITLNQKGLKDPFALDFVGVFGLPSEWLLSTIALKLLWDLIHLLEFKDGYMVEVMLS